MVSSLVSPDELQAEPGRGQKDSRQGPEAENERESHRETDRSKKKVIGP